MWYVHVTYNMYQAVYIVVQEYILEDVVKRVHQHLADFQTHLPMTGQDTAWTLRLNAQVAVRQACMNASIEDNI